MGGWNDVERESSKERCDLGTSSSPQFGLIAAVLDTSISWCSTSLLAKVWETEYCANRGSLSDLLSSLIVNKGLTAN